MSESSRTTTGEPLNVEDLFATDDTDISIDDEETETAKPGTQTTTAAAEDTTAGEVFAQLREDHETDDDDGDDVDAVTTESPEDIMARADEDAEHVDQIDDAIRADEGALDDLLLTGRRKADGFLWVETDDDAPDSTADASGNDVTSLFESTDDTDDADDDFSLSEGDDQSFEARAATFDDVDGEFDDSGFDDGADEDDASSVDGDATDDGTDDPGRDSDSTHPMDAPTSTDEPERSADSNDDDGGLASRIRSILSG